MENEPIPELRQEVSISKDLPRIFDESKLTILESLGYKELEVGSPEFMDNGFLRNNIEDWQSKSKNTKYFFMKQTDRYTLFFSATEITSRRKNIRLFQSFHILSNNREYMSQLNFRKDCLIKNSFEKYAKKIEEYSDFLWTVSDMQARLGDIEHKFTNKEVLYIFRDGALFSIGEYIFFIESEFDPKIKCIEHHTYSRIWNEFEYDLIEIEKDKNSIRDNKVLCYSRKMAGDINQLLKSIEKVYSRGRTISRCKWR